MKRCLEKYAQLVIEKGVNLQKGQPLMIQAAVHSYEFVRLLCEKAYAVGASEVYINWRDDLIERSHLMNQSEERLALMHPWVVASRNEPVAKGAAVLSLVSPIPNHLSGVDGKKMAVYYAAADEAFKPFRAATRSNQNEWCIVADSNPYWAAKVFPELSVEEAEAKLWDAILSAMRIDEENDAYAAWNQHDEALTTRCELLNQKAFAALHFKNAKGTDLKVALPKHHVWSGGGEWSKKGVFFNANMPTEEVFTAPMKWHVDGKVFATKPLNHNGTLVENFWFEFKDGKVVAYDAEKGKEALEQILTADAGSCYLGEVAIVEHDSPISKSGILFYNTLFDENASCHLALGSAYPSSVEGGTEMSDETLAEVGVNQSIKHVDFMFGDETMNITGIDENGNETLIFENGRFILEA